MYQSSSDAEHSHEEHTAIVDAIEARNEPLALELMDSHLRHVEQGLTLPNTPTAP
jgi:DNA-binding GntR family transcriptional regulator